MAEDEQVVAKTSTEPSRWIGGSLLVEQFDSLYDLEGLIHHGANADVSKCRLKNREKIQAVKSIIKQGHRKTPIKLASLVLQLDHPNLVVLREILESPTHIYIVQDYIDGPNLFEKIGQMNPYTEHDVSRYSLQILKGLQYMHERNIFHGKLHGENVLVRGQDQEERLCLVDYAYSNLCTRNAITQLVHDSPSFCAPQILRGESLSAASDLWQLGILVFFCLTGEYPFHGSSKKIFQQILNGEVDFQALEWEHISSNGRSFVANLLKLNVRERLTINQALAHPWIREKVYRAETLAHAQAKIQAIQSAKKNAQQEEHHDDD